MIELAKPALDVGVYTDDLDASMAFWRDGLALAYEELLKVGGGVHQHRLGLHGAVLKLNASRHPLDEAPTGLAGLRIAVPGLDGHRSHRSPEGVAVEEVRPGTDGVTAVEVVVEAADPAATRAWWVDGLGAAAESDGRVRVGETLLAFAPAPGRPRSGGMRARGLRYLTVQVRDVVAAHAALVAAGVEEGQPPVRLGEVAAISFVRTPDGDWVELSQRASLTGPLGDAGL